MEPRHRKALGKLRAVHEGLLLGQLSCSPFWGQAALGTEWGVGALAGLSCVKGRKPVSAAVLHAPRCVLVGIAHAI